MSDLKNGAKLCAKDLNKTYGKQKVLENLNLTIEPGCIYGLIGRNGAGKTTLMGILTGQNTMDSGSVTYGGEPVWENMDVLSKLCFSRELNGMNPVNGQNALRIRDYLAAAKIFYPMWDETYAKALLEKFGLKDSLKKQISKLSKGQMSMVTITLALASRAPITILDEPVAGLDVIAREQFYRLLLDDYAKTNRTFIISTHIIEEAAKVFERVLVLDAGKIIADTPTDDLIEQFRYVSGADETVDAAIAAAGGEVLETEKLGKHKMMAVRGTEETFAALGAEQGLSVEPMNLQNVFVALCGHGDAEA